MITPGGDDDSDERRRRRHRNDDDASAAATMNCDCAADNGGHDPPRRRRHRRRRRRPSSASPSSLLTLLGAGAALLAASPSSSSIHRAAVVVVVVEAARGWQDLVNVPRMNSYKPDAPNPLRFDLDPARDSDENVLEEEPLEYTRMPSEIPTSNPSRAPTSTPSDVPSGSPTATPSELPTSAPSSGPTDAPSYRPSVAPTSVPSAGPSPAPTHRPTISMAPTKNIWITEPRPSSLPAGYFDYDPASPRGPNRWGGARGDETDEGEYWDDFSKYIDPSLNNNVCNGGSNRQSPIDVRFEWARGTCLEYHQIRHRQGEYSVEDPLVETRILPSKLRIVYPRRWDPDASWATDNDYIKGPSADIPKGWGHQLPVLHVDIKIPSEHWLEGRQYEAEYQIYLIQNSNRQRGAPAISILIGLHPENKPNEHLQIALDQFQKVWDYDEAQCEAKKRRERRVEALEMWRRGGGTGGEEQSTWLDEPEELEEEFQQGLEDKRRKAQQYREFDVWHKEIITSFWFFGYLGSLTEPPCTEFLEWRIIDTPTTVSREQLFQMKKLLFHHEDSDCRRTSTHFDGSVARPIQPYRGRELHRCMCRDFIDDKTRKSYGMNRCEWRDRDEFGFDKDIYTQEWYDMTHPKTEEPTRAPRTGKPTKFPTPRPTRRPRTEKPTKFPVPRPTRKPKMPVAEPTKRPRPQPTPRPTKKPKERDDDKNDDKDDGKDDDKNDGGNQCDDAGKKCKKNTDCCSDSCKKMDVFGNPLGKCRAFDIKQLKDP
mmetsp:Transcript_55382/g.165980  ORF Transcript_55382/g.165980 Transcript_55382/m.165980 type:complete len:766 (-) Transcript_55382:602-2899(-)